MLVYTSPGGVASYFYSESMRILPSEYAAASWFYDAAASTGYYRARFEFLNSAGAVILSTGQTAYLNTTGTVSYGPFQAPAATTYVRIRFDHYADAVGGNPTNGATLALRAVTVVKADTTGKISASRTNSIANPSLEANITDFFSNTAFGAYDLATLSQSSTYARFGTKSGKAVLPGGDKASWWGWLIPGGLTIGNRYTFSVYVRADPGSAPVRADVLFVSSSDWSYVQGEWVRLSVTFTAVQAHAFVGLGSRLVAGNQGTYYADAALFEAGSTVGDYFDGSTPANPALGWTYAWTGAAQNSTSTATISRSLGTTRTNLLPNPSFGVDAASWSTAGTTVALARDASLYAYAPPGSLKITNTNTRTDIVQVPSIQTTYRTNLSNNPSFHVNTAGWQTDLNNTFALTAVPNPSGGGHMRATVRPEWAGSTWGFEIRSTAAQRVPVVAGQLYAFALSWYVNSGVGSTNRISVIGRFYNAAGAVVGSPINSVDSNNPVGNWRRLASGAYAAPAGAVSFALEVNADNNSGGSRLLPSGAGVYLMQILIESTGAVGAYFDGSYPASGGGNVQRYYSWNGVASNSASTERTDTTIYTPTPVVTPIPSGPDAGAYSDFVPVVAGLPYVVSFHAIAPPGMPATTFTLVLWWHAGDGTTVTATRIQRGTAGAAWVRMSASVVCPAGAALLRVGILPDAMPASSSYNIDAVQVEQTDTLGTYFDGDTAASDGWSYSWVGATGASPSVAASTTIPYVPPLAYVDILGPTHDIVVTREALNVGTLTANIVDSSLDPAKSALIRPGRAVRLEARTDDWLPVFTGHVTHASVDYDLSLPDASKRARIELTAVDAVQTLGNQNRADGVATIPELPAILAGCGVPWNVNGSGSQIGSVPVYVAKNESASALDQVAITRDSNLGYAWVDRRGVLQVWDRNKISTIPAGPVLNEGVYKDVDVSYNTDDLINEVNITFLRFNPTTQDTEEVGYGPYRNEQSILDWGVHSAMFTIQGITENTASMAAFAQGVLDANSIPSIRLTGMDLKVRLTDDRFVVTASNWWAWADLYDLVSVTCQRASINAQQSRVTSIRHSISAPDSKWLVELGFADLSTVSFPSAVPSPTAGTDGTTVSEMLRPVGEVSMFYGYKSQIPAGWLALDGTSFSSSTYPKLYALLGTTTLPNLTDRFPIGAGTKGVGTVGGSPTHTQTAAEMPYHAHLQNVVNGTVGVGGYFGTSPSLNNSFGNSGVPTSAAGESRPMDIMNPWFALWFIIRAS